RTAFTTVFCSSNVDWGGDPDGTALTLREAAVPAALTKPINLSTRYEADETAAVVGATGPSWAVGWPGRSAHGGGCGRGRGDRGCVGGAGRAQGRHPSGVAGVGTQRGG